MKLEDRQFHLNIDAECRLPTGGGGDHCRDAKSAPAVRMSVSFRNQQAGFKRRGKDNAGSIRALYYVFLKMNCVQRIRQKRHVFENFTSNKIFEFPSITKARFRYI